MDTQWEGEAFFSTGPNGPGFFDESYLVVREGVEVLGKPVVIVAGNGTK